MGCLLIDPSFDDQRLVGIVVVAVVKKGRQVSLKVLLNQLGKCQSPSGECQSPSRRNENRSPAWLPHGNPLHLLSISHLGFTHFLAFHLPHSLGTAAYLFFLQ